ncbi:hypothetical protein Q9Q51_06430 [Campylobacter upsaliensis]|uniref:Uncharacterized protein n=3 Tax=Campylobacter upsaliensis TaxID=28080 RepID=A0A828R018_CAMUP|nr:hypothetical protein [Campylobacter upsaliensis]EAB5281816.1 hypothetical protein [Campylobacter upsaliensis]EAH5199923.1 hypothetical protein [Campylobacter upsaliensis]EAH5217057.1 hypothetical protein [Campylobacter upsaliensis]EAH5546330.1 hypothetical protein [Campylobacter upsaliensis]EAH5553287.1 hypothetical protein [Campylobacter upsaliensis]
MWEFVLILICDFSLYFIENLKKVFLGRVILVILFIVFVALFCVEGLLFHLLLILELSLLLYLFLGILFVKFKMI